MTRHTDAEQERASLGAFIDRAGRDGFDTAHTFFDCGEVVFLNPDTADLWGFWQAARRAQQHQCLRGGSWCLKKAQRLWPVLFAQTMPLGTFA